VAAFLQFVLYPSQITPNIPEANRKEATSALTDMQYCAHFQLQIFCARLLFTVLTAEQFLIKDVCRLPRPPPQRQCLKFLEELTCAPSPPVKAVMSLKCVMPRSWLDIPIMPLFLAFFCCFGTFRRTIIDSSYFFLRESVIVQNTWESPTTSNICHEGLFNCKRSNTKRVINKHGV